MHLLRIGNMQLPRIYVCDDAMEVFEARQHGIPYIKKPRKWSDEKLIKAVLWTTLRKKFPHVNWHKVLGVAHNLTVDVHVPEGKVHVFSGEREFSGGDGGSDRLMQVSDDYRTVTGGPDVDEDAKPVDYEQCTIDDFIGDDLFNVSIEELQSLKLLPTFMDDIANAIKVNIQNTIWLDGYNKKLSAPTGFYGMGEELPNLIILDISGSIPSGVAATMVSLIDTLKSQTNADLIITSCYSRYWKSSEDLPTPDELNYMIGGCNEVKQFYEILQKHILGRRWGNVIIFGDNDAPTDKRIRGRLSLPTLKLSNTTIERIMAFHTYSERVPGYGLWCKEAAPKAEIVYNTDWVTSLGKW